MTRYVSAALICVAALGVSAAQSVRVVDSVNVTVAREEAAHALAGEGMAVGEAAGRKWRSAAGWFGYSLRIYDDSPLTLVLVVADGSGEREAFDVQVDGQKAAAFVRLPHESEAGELRVNLPLAVTAGKTVVNVRLQAHAGARTARLLEARSVQEHLEWTGGVYLRD